MGGLPTSTVNGFAVDPADAKVMYVAMRNGIFRSADGGSTWTLANGPKNVAAVAVHPKRLKEVYAMTMDGVLFRSPDGGVQWAAVR